MVRRIVMVMVVVVVMVGLAPAHAQDRTHDNVAARNRAAIHNALAQLAAGNVEGYFQLYADQFKANQDDAVLYDTAPADWLPFTNALTSAIPNLRAVPKVIIVQGDRAAVELAFIGTFSQPFSFAPFGADPLPPTNERVSWAELHFLRFNDEGEVIEDRSVSAPDSILVALGLIPASDEANQGGTPFPAEVRYEWLSADALLATYISGREAQTAARLQEQVELGLSGDTTSYYSYPYVSWTGGSSSSVTTSDALDDLQFGRAIAAAMPDAAMSADILVAEGDWVAGLVTVTGTSANELNLGEAGIFPPTGRSMVWQFGVIQRYDARGKVVEEWIETDPSPMLTAVGLMPPMESDE